MSRYIYTVLISSFLDPRLVDLSIHVDAYFDPRWL